MKIKVLLLTAVFFGLLVSCAWALNEQEIQKIQDASPAKAPAEPVQARKLLVFNLCKGYGHSSIPYVAKAIEVMGQKTGAYTTVMSEDMAVFSPESLAQFDAVCFNNTTHLKFDDPAHREALMNFVKSGKGIVGIHAATDNFYTWPEAAEMMGGVFVSHPWTAGGTWAVKLVEPGHPLNAAFGGEGFTLSDEIYLVKQLDLRKNAKILLTLDFSDAKTAAAGPQRDVPISWVRDFGQGRVFYCSLGHNHEVLWNPKVLGHYLAGIQFALGDYAADTTPSGADSSDVQSILAGVHDYEFSDDEAPFYALSELIRGTIDSPENLRADELAMVDFLKSEATFAAKQNVCRELRVIGTDASVDVLAEMLLDEKTAEPARLALEAIDSPRVNTVLRKSIRKTSGRVQIGIIHSLGMRRAVEAVKPLGRFAGRPDAAVREAAIHALGRIATPEAAEILQALSSEGPEEVKRAAMDALLLCARMNAEDGHNTAAAGIYRKLYEMSSAPLLVRAAALRRLGMVEPAFASEQIKTILTAQNHPMTAAAISLVPLIQDSGMDSVAEAVMPELSDENKLRLLGALVQRGSSGAVPAVRQALKSDTPEVRIAALNVLGVIGQANEVILLAENAAAQSGAVQDAARQSLYSLNAPHVEPAIMGLLAGAMTDDKVQYELIRAVGERQIAQAGPLLIETAQSPDRNVRLESVKVLREVGSPEQTAALLDLLEKAGSVPERRELEKTLTAVVLKHPESDRRVRPVIARLQNADESFKESLLTVLGGIPDQDALNELLRGASGGDEKIARASVRALADWPDARPLPVLEEIAETSENATLRILALRGFINQIRLAGDDSVRKVAMFGKAMDLAANVQEKRQVLSGLGQMGSMDAYRFLLSYTDDAELGTEARNALLQNAEALYMIHHESLRDDVETIVQTAENATVKSRAEKLLEAIDRIQSFITNWQMAGPYLKPKGVDINKLLDHAFEPEQGGAGVQWIQAAGIFEEGRVGVLDFNKTMQGNDRVVYLRTAVYSPEKQQAVLELGSDDGIKVWLNGAMVHAKNAMRPVNPGEDKVNVTLNAGWNQLMVKVFQASGGWGMAARFASPEGGVVKGLKISTEKGVIQ